MGLIKALLVIGAAASLVISGCGTKPSLAANNGESTTDATDTTARETSTSESSGMPIVANTQDLYIHSSEVKRDPLPVYMACAWEVVRSPGIEGLKDRVTGPDVVVVLLNLDGCTLEQLDLGHDPWFKKLEQKMLVGAFPAERIRFVYIPYDPVTREGITPQEVRAHIPVSEKYDLVTATEEEARSMRGRVHDAIYQHSKRECPTGS